MAPACACCQASGVLDGTLHFKTHPSPCPTAVGDLLRCGDLLVSGNTRHRTLAAADPLCQRKAGRQRKAQPAARVRVQLACSIQQVAVCPYQWRCGHKCAHVGAASFFQHAASIVA